MTMTALQAHIVQSATHPIAWDQIKEGQLLLFQGKQLCRVASKTLSKTGKHGTARCCVFTADVVSGKSVDVMWPGNAARIEVQQCVATQRKYTLFDISCPAPSLDSEGEAAGYGVAQQQLPGAALPLPLPNKKEQEVEAGYPIGLLAEETFDIRTDLQLPRFMCKAFLAKHNIAVWPGAAPRMAQQTATTTLGTVRNINKCSSYAPSSYAEPAMLPTWQMDSPAAALKEVLLENPAMKLQVTVATIRNKLDFVVAIESI